MFCLGHACRPSASRDLAAETLLTWGLPSELTGFGFLWGCVSLLVPGPLPLPLNLVIRLLANPSNLRETMQDTEPSLVPWPALGSQVHEASLEAESSFPPRAAGSFPSLTVLLLTCHLFFISHYHIHSGPTTSSNPLWA